MHSSPHCGLVTVVNWVTLPLRSTLITRASSLLRAAPPLVLASGFFLMVSAICHFPLTSKTKFSRSVPKPALRSCRLYTGCRWDRKQVSSQLILEQTGGSSFDSALLSLTMRHRTVCFRSSPQCLPDTLHGVPFPQSFTTTPFECSSTGQFEACSCKPTPGGRLPSLVQLSELALAFVTHPNLG
jgi:hypothetical protein